MKAKFSSEPLQTIRFFTIVNQSGSDTDPDNTILELDESDVVWSPSETNYLSSPPSPSVTQSPQKSRILHEQQQHLFRPEKSGLSAALSDDHRALVRRKSNLNPSVKSESFSGGIYFQSAPVNVPNWGREVKNNNLDQFDRTEDELNDDFEGKMIPPHEIVAQSHVTFSVFEGAGRTLKGRDLRRVRNAVFQRTGFID
jgi:hypothetical protein